LSRRAPEEDTFKGYPVIKIFTGGKYNGEEEQIILGVRKARAICDNIDYVRKFTEKHERKGGKND